MNKSFIKAFGYIPPMFIIEELLNVCQGKNVDDCLRVGDILTAIEKAVDREIERREKMAIVNDMIVEG